MTLPTLLAIITTMENNLEHLTEDRHFKIREKMQVELIRDFFGLNDPDSISNEQAYDWIKTHSKTFDVAFSKVADEYPSFWDDAERDLKSAAQLIKQKIAEEETVLSEK